MSPLVTILCSASGAAFVTGLMGIIAWALKRRAEKKDNEQVSVEERMSQVEQRMDKMETNMEAIVAGIRSLLYSEIKDKARVAIAAGEITTEDLEDITRKHELYHNGLSGNGYLDTLMDKLRKLPVRE